MRRLIGWKADVGARDYHGRTPLHEVCFSDNHRAAKLLIELKANVNAVDKCGMTPLHISGKCQRHKLINTFLLMGGNPLICDAYNDSLLDVTDEEKLTKIEILKSCVEAREKLREKLVGVHLVFQLALKKLQGQNVEGLPDNIIRVIPDDVLVKNIIGEIEKEIIIIDNINLNTEEILLNLNRSSVSNYNFKHLYKYLLSGTQSIFVSL